MDNQNDAKHILITAKAVPSVRDKDEAMRPEQNGTKDLSKLTTEKISSESPLSLTNNEIETKFYFNIV